MRIRCKRSLLKLNDSLIQVRLDVQRMKSERDWTTHRIRYCNHRISDILQIQIRGAANLCWGSIRIGLSSVKEPLSSRGMSLLGGRQDVLGPGMVSEVIS